MNFAVTERQVFKRCRRKWWYGSRNGLGLAKIVPQKALSLGTLVHEALADWLEHPNDDLVQLFFKHSNLAMEDAKARYRKLVGANPSQDELGPILDAVDMGRHIVANYQKKYGQPLHKGFSLVQPEQEMLVNIPTTDHYLKAKLDGIIQDDKGQLYILEHKTYSSRSNQHILDTNDQFLAYIWAANQLEMGTVVGLAYDGLWKRAQPPKGSTFDDLFTRTLLFRPQDELDEFERFLAVEAIEMASVAQQDDDFRYINRRWEGCYDCDFEPLCTAQSRGEDVEHIKNSMYYVRTDEEEEDV
jgi:hypothetical protein